MRQCTSYACNFINFKKSFFLQIPGNQSFRRIANGTTCAGGYSEASQSVRSTGSAHSGGAPRSRSRPMTGGGATGGSSSAAAEGTAVDALGRAVGDLRMGTMGTPLDPPPESWGQLKMFVTVSTSGNSGTVQHPVEHSAGALDLSLISTRNVCERRRRRTQRLGAPGARRCFGKGTSPTTETATATMIPTTSERGRSKTRASSWRWRGAASTIIFKSKLSCKFTFSSTCTSPYNTRVSCRSPPHVGGRGSPPHGARRLGHAVAKFALARDVILQI